MNEQDGLWPRNCDGCGNTQAMEFDHEHLTCMPALQLTRYLEFWNEVATEERERVRANVNDEISRRKAAYALWVASRRVGAGKRELKRRSATNERL